MGKQIDRRNFIKGVSIGFFCSTGAFFDSLAYACELEEDKSDFTIFFMGKYGKRVLNRFRLLRRINPVLHKCKHVAMDVNSEAGFFEVSNSTDTLPLLARACRTATACFVMDPLEPGIYMHAENLARVMNGTGKPTVLALAPGKTCAMSLSVFDLFIETGPCLEDGAALALRTLYSTYLGCGQLGNLMCLKLDLPDILEAAAEGTRTARLHTITCGISTDRLPDVPAMPWGDTGYTIVELPDVGWNNAFELINRVLDYMPDMVGDSEWGYLYHMSRSAWNVKVTSFVL